jgi:hypothetical protein
MPVIHTLPERHPPCWLPRPPNVFQVTVFAMAAHPPSENRLYFPSLIRLYVIYGLIVMEYICHLFMDIRDHICFVTRCHLHHHHTPCDNITLGCLGVDRIDEALGDVLVRIDGRVPGWVVGTATRLQTFQGDVLVRVAEKGNGETFRDRHRRCLSHGGSRRSR